MFKTIAAKVERDTDFPRRQYDLDLRTRVLEGTLYDVLEHPFHEERNLAGEYVPLYERRPSTRYGLCRVVVDDSVSLLFDEGHFPTVHCEDKPTAEALASIIKENLLNEVMISAATCGSVGSVAVLLRVLRQKNGNHRAFFKVLTTQYLTPTWDANAPDTLLKVREQYKVKGSELVKFGYVIEHEKVDYWFAREWDENAETWFLPWPVRSKEGEEKTAPVVDAARTVTHGLGLVPLVWIKNLPGGDDIDGACTFPPQVIDDEITIDYQLSQLGRGLKYSSDPTLLIKEPSPLMAATAVSGADGSTSAVVKGGDNAIIVGPEGDAKLLEINGGAAEAVLEYVRCVRELALETAHGNRANADKISAAQSGRAMELMNQSLIWLADKLRISYGEGGFLGLMRMVVAASKKFPLALRDGTKLPDLSDKMPLALKWPRWYAPTADDRLNDANTLSVLTAGKIMSRETATTVTADIYDIEDIPAEIARVNAETNADAKAEVSKATALAATVKPVP